MIGASGTKSSLSIVLVSLMALEAAAQAPRTSQILNPEEAQALMKAAQALNRAPESLRLLGQSEVRVPFVEGEFTGYKLLDQDTGEALRVVVDSRGQEIDYEALLAEGEKNQFARMGRADALLDELVQKVSPDQELPVLVKLRVAEPIIDKSRYLEGPKPSVELLARDASVVSEGIARDVERLRPELEYLNVAPKLKMVNGTPFARAVLTASEIRDLARSPAVELVAFDGEREVLDYPTIGQSLPTTRTDDVHALGHKGSGVKIAVLEGGGLDKSQSCFNIAEVQNSGASPSAHMTNSAAIIGNNMFPFHFGGTIFYLCSGTRQGYAPEATVYIANASSYTDRYDWAKSKGVNVVTMSWHFPSEETSGALHSRDVFFDYAAAHYPYPSIFTSAGNQASSSAFASGKGFNILGVANILNDGDGNRANDAISSSSSWKDPTSPFGDREVPAIAAPGSRHDLLDRDFGGTSAATPVSAAITASIMSSNASLKYWPEAIRAILMATANYQAGDGADWSKYSDGKDGTGMLNTQYAYWAASRRQTGTSAEFRAHDYGSVYASSFEGGFLKEKWYAWSNGSSTSKLRVLFNWNSKTDGTTSVLDADLDLWVYDPNGNLKAVSSTWDSNYEFVEFAAPVAGVYEIRVRGYSVPSDLFTYFGVAWTAHYE